VKSVEKRLAGKTALVTGAARRIGRAVSVALAASGANVVIHYSRSARAAEALAAELATLGVRAHPVQADLAVPEQAEALVARASELAGPIDLLVNNASVFEPETLEAATLESLIQNVTVNSWAPFVLTRALARLDRGGKVVNLLDTRVAGLDLGHAGYILSKHALAVITRMSATAFAPGLLVNAVAPGLVLPPSGQDETYLARLARDLPLKRHGAPEDVARAIVFLLESDFITGQIVFVDGGSHLLEAHP
jgi:NAD(P)-dependent dehydrogenase (short-subunit alcohol dehydrogenase family)